MFDTFNVFNYIFWVQDSLLSYESFHIKSLLILHHDRFKRPQTEDTQVYISKW